MHKKTVFHIRMAPLRWRAFHFGRTPLIEHAGTSKRENNETVLLTRNSFIIGAEVKRETLLLHLSASTVNTGGLKVISMRAMF